MRGSADRRNDERNSRQTFAQLPEAPPWRPRGGRSPRWRGCGYSKRIPHAQITSATLTGRFSAKDREAATAMRIAS
jgi:hypothetical protein